MFIQFNIPDPARSPVLRSVIVISCVFIHSAPPPRHSHGNTLITMQRSPDTRPPVPTEPSSCDRSLLRQNWRIKRLPHWLLFLSPKALDPAADTDCSELQHPLKMADVKWFCN